MTRGLAKFTWGWGGPWSPKGQLSVVHVFHAYLKSFGFSYHTAKLPCHMLEPLVNCRMLLATLEMQAQTYAHPVTMLVPLCHAGGAAL